MADPQVNDGWIDVPPTSPAPAADSGGWVDAPPSAPPPPSPAQPSGLERGISSIGTGLQENVLHPMQQAAIELSRLNRAAAQGQFLSTLKQDFPPAGSIGGALESGYKPIYSAAKNLLIPDVKRDDQGNIDWPSTFGANVGKYAPVVGPMAYGKYLGAAEGAAPEAAAGSRYSQLTEEAAAAARQGPESNILPTTRGLTRYSPAADKVAASLKPIAGIDMPANINAIMPELRESFADLGYDPAQSFQGREGSLYFKTGVQHAVDLAENRAQQILAPALNDTTPADVLLAKSPDLAAYLEVKPGEMVPNTLIDQARQNGNSLLTRSNYYTKPLSKQFAASDIQIDAKKVADQARDLLYNRAQELTGRDTQGLRVREARLINTADAANSTHNALSQAEANFQANPPTPLQKAAGIVGTAMHAKASPLTAALTYATRGGELPGFTASPMEEFNGNMRAAFGDITPQRANLNMGIRAPGMVSPVTPGAGRMLPQNVAAYNVGVAGGPSITPSVFQLPQRAGFANFGQTEIRGTPFIPREPLALPSPAVEQPAAFTPPGYQLARRAGVANYSQAPEIPGRPYTPPQSMPTTSGTQRLAEQLKAAARRR